MADRRLFRDRREAGRVLAGLLAHHRDRPGVIVLGLPRGGAPVAYEVATALGAPLDVFLVRKLGVPGHEELAMGAIASGGTLVLNEEVVRGLRIGPEAIRQVAEREGRELTRREQAYRDGRPRPELAGRTVILVDDGLATGASMRAAVHALRQHRLGRIVVAVPAAPESACRELEAMVDEVVCATTPLPFLAVGLSYWDFCQTTDKEVRNLLRAAAARRPGAAASQEPTAEAALRGLERFPTWMWRNTVVLDFVGWLRDHNHWAGGGQPAKAGFHGLDLYSLHRSAREVVAYLEGADPAAAERARRRYACFDHVAGDDGQAYGFAAFGAGDSCERETVEQLIDLQRHALDAARRDGLPAEDEAFYAEQNARTVKAAEAYYRSMFTGRVSSWNLRDQHMADTLDALADHLSRRRGGDPARIVVWAHNSHLGDARATEVASQGELNVGQLVRERHPGDCRLIGLTTYTGTVTAADDWGGPAERKQVRPALPDSVEELFHEVGREQFLVRFDTAPGAAAALRSPRLERAIGVIYRPQTERQSHYFMARVTDQFDAVIHLDQTRALEPLERTAGWERGEVPETYPVGV